MSLASESMRTYGPGDPVLDTEIMEFFRGSYLSPEQYDEPFASPLRAEVDGFPPTLVVVGTIDALHDEGVAFARKLEAANRPVVLQSYEGMPHIFFLFPGIDAGTKCVDQIASFLSRELGG